MPETDPLAGQLVLLIEDDAFLSNYVGGALASAGAQIIGPARTSEEAELLIQRLRVSPQAVVASATVVGVNGEGFANALVGLGAPILLLKKDGRHPDPLFRCDDVLTVPFAAYQVVESLRRLRENAIAASPHRSAEELAAETEMMANNR
jgi:hypothetical protein